MLWQIQSLVTGLALAMMLAPVVDAMLVATLAQLKALYAGWEPWWAVAQAWLQGTRGTT